jgi:hypothetical protein
MVRKETSQQWGLAGANGQFCHPSTALPRKGEKGDSGGVVEIGALDHAGEHPSLQSKRSCGRSG